MRMNTHMYNKEFQINEYVPVNRKRESVLISRNIDTDLRKVRHVEPVLLAGFAASRIEYVVEVS